MKIKLSDIAHWNTKTTAHQRLITAEILRALPEPNATAEEPANRHKIVAHYFGGPVDVYLIDLTNPETGEAFGYMKIAGHGDGEWGYFSLPELLALKIPTSWAGITQPIERDTYWDTKTPATAVDDIRPID